MMFAFVYFELPQFAASQVYICSISAVLLLSSFLFLYRWPPGRVIVIIVIIDLPTRHNWS